MFFDSRKYHDIKTHQFNGAGLLMSLCKVQMSGISLCWFENFRNSPSGENVWPSLSGQSVY